MKKLSTLILFFSVFALSAFAQNVEVIIVDNVQKTDTIVKEVKVKIKNGYQPHAVGIEASLGLGNDMDYGFGFGLDASVRYTWNFIPYVGWDALKLKFFANGWFEQIGYINALSGIRFSTPRFGKSKSSHVYTAFCFGVAYYRDAKLQYRDSDSDWRGIEGDYLGFEKLGFTWEWDIVGIHFRHLFMNVKYSYLNEKHYIGFGLGIDIGKLVAIQKKK